MAGKVGQEAMAPFAASVVLILLALAIGDQTVGIILGAVVMLLLIYTMTKLPLRISIMALMFCAFVLENPNDLPASGKWKSPLYMVGAVLLTHLNLTTGISGLSFSGMDIALVTLLIIAWQRRSSGSKIDTAGQLPTPQPLRRLALVSLAGTMYVWMSGLIRGGDFSISLWQVDKVIYLPIVFFIFHFALRGPKDHAALAKVLIIGATIRAALAIYIGSTVILPPDEEGNTSLPYQTSHHDSMTFAAAVIVLLAMVLFKAHKSAPKYALGLLPILLYGMVMNHRRMVWVQIGVVFVLLYFLTPMNPAKRKVRKIAWILSPLAVMYVIAGWNSKSSAFKPVQTIRSVVEPATDASSMTREIENYNLIYTIRQYPILGTGYGNGYWEMIPLPPMGYPLERYIPHNSLLGLWVYCGIFGVTAITFFWAGGMYFGLRAYRASKKPTDRTAALMSFGAVIIYTVQCWGDMGLGSWIGVFTTAPALVVAGKLAVATDAWPVQQKAKKPSAAAAPAPADPTMAPGPVG